ncbi:prolactin-like protein 1 precursor [Cavia porcellus]|uniref:Prolactin n=2 Tax=Cavia porcellus TaxID=10141 RepID=D9ZD71_CAVPO|nr:prolactin-like protein 1 precursor [Cavia porcellus]ADL32659.1 prolactin-like protein 1 [Cavia porcellus]CDW51460.1 TPA: growth hormone C4 [Cavia porcellus]
MNAKVKGSRLMLLLMSSLLLWKNVASQSKCIGRTDHWTTLPHLVQHAVTLSDNIHVLTSELYQDFITLYSVDRDLYLKNMKSCHTASITTPLDKEQILKMKEKDMIILVIRLMSSWDNPLSHLIAQSVRLPKIPQRFMKKAELIREKMHYLLEGLEIMTRQVGLQDTDYADYAIWTEPPSLQSAEGKDFIDTFHHLCHCFHRDIYIVDSLLKVLKAQVSHDRHN